MAAVDHLEWLLPSHQLQQGGVAGAACSVELVGAGEQMGTPPLPGWWVGASQVQLQLPKLWVQTWASCSMEQEGAHSLPLPPPPALLSHANAAAQPGIPILLRGPRRSTLPSQAQKCLLLLSGFYLLSAPSPTLELSQGQAQVLSQPSQVCTCSG